MEEWKAVPGYEGIYEVSSAGRFRSLDRLLEFPPTERYPNGRKYRRKGQMLRIHRKNNGELSFFVSISDKGVNKTLIVARTVMMAFDPRDDMDDLRVIHLDGDHSNNDRENLKWCTLGELQKFHFDQGIREIKPETREKISRAKTGGKHQTGQKNANAILKPYQVREIRSRDVKLWPDPVQAEMYGVSSSTIQKIRNGKSWKHIR